MRSCNIIIRIKLDCHIILRIEQRLLNNCIEEILRIIFKSGFKKTRLCPSVGASVCPFPISSCVWGGAQHCCCSRASSGFCRLYTLPTYRVSGPRIAVEGGVNPVLRIAGEGALQLYLNCALIGPILVHWKHWTLIGGNPAGTFQIT